MNPQKVRKRLGRPPGKKPTPPVDVVESAVMTLRDVAEYLHCHYTTAHRLANQGKIPGALRLGSDWRFLKSEIDKWIAKQELTPPPAPERKRPR
jgi:excisionase family DNA binding protein